MKTIIKVLVLALFVFASCTVKNSKEDAKRVTETVEIESTQKSTKEIDESIPTIGLLMYDRVLMTEVTAPMDVFSKHTEAGDTLFNVITIAETLDPVETEEGLVVVPDFTFDTAPKLDVLFVPSAYDMWTAVRNEKLVNFIIEKNKETTYTVSNCGGAQLIGKSGIASGKKIVTWIGGGEQLQKDYPDLLVQNDAEVSFVTDGKFYSSNGNLASYISSLELLEKMTSKEQRLFVESYLYLDRLKDWDFNEQK